MKNRGHFINMTLIHIAIGIYKTVDYYSGWRAETLIPYLIGLEYSFVTWLECNTERYNTRPLSNIMASPLSKQNIYRDGRKAKGADC